jgi:Lar family restriction alleviation protein
MAATQEDIRGWLKRASANTTYMLVVCDTYDWSDYPVYVVGDEDVRKKYEGFNGKNMQQVMEVYDLSMDLEKQLAEHRAMHLPEQALEREQEKVLKPCPCCGGEAVLLTEVGKNWGVPCVECKECGLRTNCGLTEEQAIKIWNRRMTSNASLIDLLEEAEYLLAIYGPKSCPNWKEGVGDCEQDDCRECRVFRCVEKLENMRDCL